MTAPAMGGNEERLRRELAEAVDEVHRLELDILSGARYGAHQRLALARAHVVHLTEQLAPFIAAEVARYADSPRAETSTIEHPAQNGPFCGVRWVDKGSHKCARAADHTLIHRCFCGCLGDVEADRA